MPVDKNDFFREMTLRICGTLDIDQALADALDYLAKHIPADTMGLGYSDVAAARIHVLARVAREGGRYIWPEDAPEISLAGGSLDYVRDGADRPALLVVNRPDDQPEELIRIFPQLISSSAMFLRLDMSGEEVGAVLISAEGPDRFTDRHAELLESVREPLTIAMINARRYRELVRVKDLLADDHRALSADMKLARGVEVVGADFGLRHVMEQVRRIAPSNSPALLLGETGTGKEVVANAIHMASPRSGAPMVSLQCGAVPETLLDSELFGHERGAFTGASERKRGRFERADGGTLFLDEVGELSQEAQVKLLRVLQERRFERVGGTRPIEVDVRVIAATHRDLRAMVEAGTFREDLWYRLNVLPIQIPPLRLRRDDVPSLIRYFVDRKAREMNLPRAPRIRSEDLERLRAYDWPGNVRELQNIVERALILSHGDTLEFPELRETRAQCGGPAAESSWAIQTLDDAMADHIRAVLERVGWRVSGPGGAAELLGMNPSTLRFRMKKLGVLRGSPLAP
ncbi:MAG: sigma 54-interacting transcriptional regulator [Myxococcota bacterium]